jgi:hypothetical protein
LHPGNWFLQLLARDLIYGIGKPDGKMGRGTGHRAMILTVDASGSIPIDAAPAIVVRYGLAIGDWPIVS